MAQIHAELVTEIAQMLGLSEDLCWEVVNANGGDLTATLNQLMLVSQAPAQAPTTSMSEAESEETRFQMNAMKRERNTRALAVSRFLKSKEKDLVLGEERLLKKAREEKEAQQALKDAEAKERRRRSDERRQMLEEFVDEEARWKEELMAKAKSTEPSPEAVEQLLSEALAESSIADANSEDAEVDQAIAKIQRDAAAYLEMSIRRLSSPPLPPSSSPTPSPTKTPHGVAPKFTSSDESTENRRQFLQSHFMELPLVSIYSDSSSSGSVDRLKSRFLSAGVSSSELKTVDLTADPELAGYIRGKYSTDGGELSLPMVLLRDQCLGTYSTIEGMSPASLQSAIAQARDGTSQSTSSTKPPSLGLVDSMLEKAEWVASWFNPFAYGRSSLPPPDASVQEFPVIHTNWYWRQLRRRFRFQEDVFMRIHETKREVRAVHKYEEVRDVQRVNSESLVITYTQGSPDHIMSSPENIEAMVAIFRAKSVRFDDLVASTLPM